MSPAAAVGNSCSDDPACGGLVSSAERTAFVEAVIAGKLEPDLTAVAYHFEGWLDKGVKDSRRNYLHAELGCVPSDKKTVLQRRNPIRA